MCVFVDALRCIWTRQTLKTMLPLPAPTRSTVSPHALGSDAA